MQLDVEVKRNENEYAQQRPRKAPKLSPIPSNQHLCGYACSDTARRRSGSKRFAQAFEGRGRRLDGDRELGLLL